MKLIFYSVEIIEIRSAESEGCALFTLSRDMIFDMKLMELNCIFEHEKFTTVWTWFSLRWNMQMKRAFVFSAVVLLSLSLCWECEVESCTAGFQQMIIDTSRGPRTLTPDEGKLFVCL